MIFIRVVTEATVKEFVQTMPANVAGMNTFKYVESDVWHGAFVNRKMVGVSCLRYRKHYATFEHTYVNPEYRRRGILSKFIRARLVEVRNSKYTSIHSTVTPMSLKMHLSLGAAAGFQYGNKNTNIIYANLHKV